MKSPDEIANHPLARLYRDVVERLRTSGSVRGAENAWIGFRQNRRLWAMIVTYGLDRAERQRQVTKVAFPDSNWTEVNAALGAGNRLKAIHELATGAGSIAKDAAGRFKVGRHGYKVVPNFTSKDRASAGSRPP